MRRLDRVFVAAIVLLIGFTPLAFGAVHPWAYSLAEGWIFGLLLLLAARFWFDASPGAAAGVSAAAASRRSLLPLGLFAALVVFQMLPMPPAAVRVVSPATYRLYQETLPGWPAKAPYSDLQSALAVNDHSGTIVSVATPAQSRKSEAPATPELRGGGVRELLSRWRPLALARPLAWSGVLAVVACACLFGLIVAYPFPVNSQDERAFVGTLLAAIVVVGLAVGVFGIIEKASWNGKILWFFAPVDLARGASIADSRARGPFINPDHFAGYLTMVFPLALSVVLASANHLGTKTSSALRWTCAATAVVAFAGILLSLSRNGLLGTLTGLVVLVALLRSLTRGSNRSSSSPFHFSVVQLALVIVPVVLAAAFLLAGPQVRADADERLADAMGPGGLGGRVAIWRRGLGLVRDFPSFGVGLGCWPAIYSKYEGAPYPLFDFSRAHNDYLQLAAETGIAGLGMLAFFLLRVGNSIRRGFRFLKPESISVVAGMVASLTAMAVEEFFDFNLQVPATAFLFTIFAALTVRLTSGHGDGVVGEGTGRRTKRIAVASALASAGFIVASATQGQTNYPYNIGTPATPAAARTILLTYPSTWYSHVVASQMFGPCSPRGLEEQSIAVGLDPTNPAVRDAYSENLDCAGRKDEALEQMTNSVLFSPEASTHSYLSPKKIVAATAQERSAVERGFEQAVGRGYPSAVPELASFYSLCDRHLDAAELYMKAAGREQESYKQERFLIAAGEAFGKAGKSKEARSAFDKAASIVPSDARPYVNLLSVVYGPAKDMEAARSTVEVGIGNGVDPIVLYSTLAETAQAANRPEVAGAALTKIVHLAPTFQNNARLAEFYLASGNADRAVNTLRKATMIEPDSAQAYVRLATAEEAAYLYAEADRDYSHALSLQPNNLEAKSRYAEFQKRTASKGASTIGDTRY